MSPKTAQEIQALKDNWVKDPCWDIETEEGFEEYAEELLAFRLQKEAEWQSETEEAIARRARVVTVETGITHSSIQQNIHTFGEIEKQLKRNQNGFTSKVEEIAIQQVRATLLLAAQVARIADVLEDMDRGTSFNISMKPFGSEQ